MQAPKVRHRPLDNLQVIDTLMGRLNKSQLKGGNDLNSPNLGRYESKFGSQAYEGRLNMSDCLSPDGDRSRNLGNGGIQMGMQMRF